jgi:hypothetical protein
MMEEDLRGRLRLAVPGLPVDWGWTAQGKPSPRIVLSMVSDVPNVTHDGPSGYRQSRVQIDIYATTYAAAKDASRRIETDLSGLRAGLILGAFKAGSRDFPPDLGAGETLARISEDYMIHHNQE